MPHPPYQNVIKPLDRLLSKELSQLHTFCFKKSWSEKDFCPTSNRFGFMVLKENVLIGFILYHIMGKDAEILTLCVHPFYQNQKIGHQLIQHMIKNTRQQNLHKIFLEVATNNKAALKLYQKNRFQKIGIRKNYYIQNEKGIDALAMQHIIK